MKARPPTYSISLAPTGRARCRVCKGRVERGEVRVVTHAPVRPNRTTRFVRHVTCVDAAFAAAMLAIHGTVERIPVAADVGARVADARSAIAASASVGKVAKVAGREA